MLNPKNDRLDYGSILSPPQNYQLDFAIGTTYSLDLDSLVGASISLGLSAECDSDLINNPIFLLEALRSTGDKIALFCEKGQIHLPNKPTPLYILLEDMVFQAINTNNLKRSKHASFHPKMWLLRYVDDEGNALYRIAVLSRNLTFDRSWDLTFAMDGQKSEEKTDKNAPLIKFIEYLTQFSTDDHKTDRIREIILELEHVHFSLNSNVFRDFEFVVNGIGDEHSIQNQHLFTCNRLEKLLIISPFLTSSAVSNFNGRMNPNSRATLITRLNSLVGFKIDDCSNFDIYVLKDEVVDGESIISDESRDIYKQDIHAKMYAVEGSEGTDLYLGSLNASFNALHGNVEFMIKLSAKRNKLNVNGILNDIFNGEKDGPKCPFQTVDIESTLEKDEKGTDLSRFVKIISRLKAGAKATSSGKCYDVILHFNDFNKDEFDDVIVNVSPLLSNKGKPISRSLVFEGLHKNQLSEFFVISVTDKDGSTIKRVVKIHVEGMPDDRDKKVVSDIINDRTAFIRYVAFLLGDDYILSSIEAEMVGKGGMNLNHSVQLPELYEKMLKAALYAPEKFHELEFLIKTLSDDDVIPEGFEDLYNMFVKVIG